MSLRPKVFLASNVFSPKELGSNEKIDLQTRERLKNLWDKLNSISDLKTFIGRFPTQEELKKAILSFDPDILGCHLSHSITAEIIGSSNIFAISTSTAGYNHIDQRLSKDILITHTPGVLHNTVADYTISLIMANLRNLIDLHNYVWSGNWELKSKWDLDQDLSSVITNKVLGIVGLGEIGVELLKRLHPWGLKILYYDIERKMDVENKYPTIYFKENLEDLFKEADIVSLHMPLNKSTENLIDKSLLSLMKRGSLLINTARGGVLNLENLLELLEDKTNLIHFGLDVFPQEPLDENILKRIRKIKQEQPSIRIILMPHNASADASTRGRMVILFLEDIIKIIESNSIEDLNEVHIIPEQKPVINQNKWRIVKYWQKKRSE